jgi:hypothetical protein
MLRRCFQKGTILPVLVLAAVLAASPALALPIVYSQAPQSPVQSTRASQSTSTFGLIFQTFSSFSLSANSSISGVLWKGSYFNTLVNNGAFNPPPNAASFAVAFYGNNSGTPGSLLSLFSFSPAAAGQTFVGQQAFPATTPTLGLGIYNYAATLPTSFLATAGTTYWLSVIAFTPDPTATQAQWGWNGGAGGSGTSFQTASGVGSVVNFTRAFSLSTSSVPEPSSLTLLGGGIAVLLARVRKRRKGGRG